MTKLEIITTNKANYNKQMAKNETLTGLAKAVGETLTLAWIKGNKWMGGLSDSKANKLYEKLMEEGYELEEIDQEFQNQMDQYC